MQISGIRVPATETLTYTHNGLNVSVDVMQVPNVSGANTPIAAGQAVAMAPAPQSQASQALSGAQIICEYSLLSLNIFKCRLPGFFVAVFFNQKKKKKKRKEKEAKWHYFLQSGVGSTFTV